MKSIVQEGSTISKAVESAWQSAGKPHEFTIKILEEPQHNFIGMTTRSAKIALFFKEPVIAGKQSHDKTDRAGRPERDTRNRSKKSRSPRPESGNGRGSFTRENRPFSGPEEAAWPKERESRKPRERMQEVAHKEQMQESSDDTFEGVFWTPEMITMAKDWLHESLSALNLAHLNYTCDVNRLYFKVAFDEPVNADTATERQIFRSFAMLLMQHMRNRLKRPLKGFKVVLSRGGMEIDEE